MTNNRLLMFFAVVAFSSTPLVAAHAYDRVTITNRTIFPASVEVNYPGCSNDRFSVPAGALQTDGSIVPGKATAPTYRGACLVTWISASLTGSDKGVTRYESSGTSYSEFTIQGTEDDFRVYSSHELANETGDFAGKSPGFHITNNTLWPISIALSQVGCLYYDTIKPGHSFDRSTGAVWFTIQANIAADGKEPRSDWDCIKPVAIIVGSILASAATAGAASFAALPAAGAMTAAAALAPIATSSAVIVGGAAVTAAGTAAGTAMAIQIGEALAPNGSGELKGQYAGADWPFRCDQKPRYTITGGWGLPGLASDGKTFAIDPGTPIKITKTNSCGNSMM